MEHAILRIDRSERGYRYNRRGRASWPLSILGFCLTDDVGRNYERWIEWINNPSTKDTESNYSFIEKEANNILVVGRLFSEDPYENCLECTHQELIDILEKWGVLYKEKHDRIIITRINGVVDLVGRRFDEPHEVDQIPWFKGTDPDDFKGPSS